LVPLKEIKNGKKTIENLNKKWRDIFVLNAKKRKKFGKLGELQKNYYLCQRYRGEIPDQKCISLLFRTYRKDLRNLFWNSSI